MNDNSFIRDQIEKAKKTHFLYEKIIKTCQSLLVKSDEPYEYIKRRFSIKHINNYEFGAFPMSDQIESLYEDGITEENLLDLRLIFKYKSFSNGVKIKSIFENYPLVFPIKDEFGYIVGLIGRTLLTKEEMKELKISKYKYSLFHRNHILYGLNFAKECISLNQTVYLVEGQIDCLSLYTKGLYNVVALGGLGLNKYQFYLLRKYGGPNLKIKLLLDNDGPGKLEAQKITNEYSRYNLVQSISIPDDSVKDIDEYIKKHNNINFLLI